MSHGYVKALEAEREKLTLVEAENQQLLASVESLQKKVKGKEESLASLSDNWPKWRKEAVDVEKAKADDRVQALREETKRDHRALFSKCTASLRLQREAHRATHTELDAEKAAHQKIQAEFETYKGRHKEAVDLLVDEEKAKHAKTQASLDAERKAHQETSAEAFRICQACGVDPAHFESMPQWKRLQEEPGFASFVQDRTRRHLEPVAAAAVSAGSPVFEGTPQTGVRGVAGPAGLPHSRARPMTPQPAAEVRYATSRLTAATSALADVVDSGPEESQSQGGLQPTSSGG